MGPPRGASAVTSQETSAERIEPQPASLRVLLLWVWDGVRANRGLVASIVALGVLQAVLTKGPLLLIKPLLEAIQGVPERQGWLMAASIDLSNALCSLLGLEFDSVAMSLLVGCAVMAALCGVLGAFAIYGVTVLSRYFATKIVVDLRNRIGAHVLDLPLRFFGVRRMGDLISHITTDTTVLARSFTLASEHIVVDPLLVLGNVVLLLVLFPQALWVLLLMVPAIALPVVKMGRRVHKRSSKSLAAMGDATESMNQMLSGIKTVKAFQLEGQRLAEFEENNARFLHRTKRMLQAKALSHSTVFMAYNLAFAAMLLVLGWLVLRGSYALSDIGAIIAPVATTYQHVKRLSRAYNTLMESAGALDRVQALLQEKPDIGHRSGGIALERIEGAVEFDSVSFAYEDEPVLRDVSFSVRPGETVALVGPSGAGKSTTLDLLARFHDPTSGRILVDGHDLRELDLARYRRRVAMVSQQPFLFNTTLLENIRCGRPDASFDEVVQAARAAQIHDFVESLPEGYDTLAGERGCNLSGGQMQRITIARALLRDPAILLLDEATSALDSESEEAVQRALANLMRGRTCFVIAHRLATVVDADQILVLDGGRLVERGRHQDLLRRKGLYHRMSQLQQIGSTA